MKVYDGANHRKWETLKIEAKSGKSQSNDPNFKIDHHNWSSSADADFYNLVLVKHKNKLKCIVIFAPSIFLRHSHFPQPQSKYGTRFDVLPVQSLLRVLI